MKIGIDVRHCQGGSYKMQFTNTFINPHAAFDNLVGVFFEDEQGELLPDAVVIYTHTKNQDLSEFFDFVPVPANAAWMGYWLLPDAGKMWRRNPNYQPFDLIELRKEDGFTRMFQREDHEVVYNSAGNTVTTRAGRRLDTNGYAGQVHLSDPAHNYGEAEWFQALPDGSIQIEDLEIGSGWDFGVWWSAPRSLVPCDCFNP